MGLKGGGAPIMLKEARGPRRHAHGGDTAKTLIFTHRSVAIWPDTTHLKLNFAITPVWKQACMFSVGNFGSCADGCPHKARPEFFCSQSSDVSFDGGRVLEILGVAVIVYMKLHISFVLHMHLRSDRGQFSLPASWLMLPPWWFPPVAN